MALIECGECKRQVSDKAPACPGCGAPIASAKASSPAPSPTATARPVSAKPKKRGTLLPLLLALMCGAGYVANRVNSGPAGSIAPSGSAPVFRQPEKVVSKRIGLKEGQAEMYNVHLALSGEGGGEDQRQPQERRRDAHDRG